MLGRARRHRGAPWGCVRAAACECVSGLQVVGAAAEPARDVALRPPPGRASSSRCGDAARAAATSASSCSEVGEAQQRARPTGARRGTRPGRGSRGRGARSRSRRRSRASPSGAPWRCRTAARVYSSTHTLAAAPRPTRPRSWCSCDRPKRSACSTTISDAFGTSTPTSITVVATSTAIWPPAKSDITAAFSAAGMRPCSRPTIAAGQRRRRAGVRRGRVLQVERLATPRPAGRPSRPAGRCADLVADARDHLVALARRRTAW